MEPAVSSKEGAQVLAYGSQFLTRTVAFFSDVPTFRRSRAAAAYHQRIVHRAAVDP